jgi:hypothetical protein
MKPFINSITNVPKEETTYHLSAVLIHRGSSAHSGHYIAHIKDRNTGFWYKFNDEKAERIEGKKLKLDSDEATENCLNGGGDNSPKFEKIKDHDWHHSNNAYLLVYKNETQLPSNLSHNYKDWNLPQYLINAIEEDNKKFDETIAEFQQKRVIKLMLLLSEMWKFSIILFFRISLLRNVLNTDRMLEVFIRIWSLSPTNHMI